VLYDNMRTVVLQRHGYDRGRHRFHPGFLDFARHCGFQPRLCAPYRAQTKGKVERFIRYLRESFWVPLSSRLTQEGLALAARGVLVLPDFIANAGGVICAAIEYRGGTEAAALAYIEEKIRANTEAVLDEVRRTGALPRTAALSLATERVHQAMRTRRWDTRARGLR
jgi:hypothetical protein